MPNKKVDTNVNNTEKREHRLIEGLDESLSFGYQPNGKNDSEIMMKTSDSEKPEKPVNVDL
ncbi:hypothetical protein OL233_07520 [Vagococcus sp. PNs007]|uniref:Uncharacterized protein n=1 Tax=Vagococcus proximus TaxID=2991417 RepID=A0ABT5X2B6_9ENTE|nr:hypothetical protein [Vagococcus proximus]MDF0480141.1 hypothetical protein [Vagococcus proximus]